MRRIIIVIHNYFFVAVFDFCRYIQPLKIVSSVVIPSGRIGCLSAIRIMTIVKRILCQVAFGIFDSSITFGQ